MSEVLQEHPDQIIVDTLELALCGVDYEPILPPADEEVQDELPIIASGSIRMKYAYDFEANAFVHVTEYLGWAEQDPEVGVEEVHRLIVWWDDGGPSVEFDLDRKEIIFEEGEAETERAKKVARLKIMNALKAIMTD